MPCNTLSTGQERAAESLWECSHTFTLLRNTDGSAFALSTVDLQPSLLLDVDVENVAHAEGAMLSSLARVLQREIALSGLVPSDQALDPAETWAVVEPESVVFGQRVQVGLPPPLPSLAPGDGQARIHPKTRSWTHRSCERPTMRLSGSTRTHRMCRRTRQFRPQWRSLGLSGESRSCRALFLRPHTPHAPGLQSHT